MGKDKKKKWAKEVFIVGYLNHEDKMCIGGVFSDPEKLENWALRFIQPEANYWTWEGFVDVPSPPFRPEAVH